MELVEVGKESDLPVGRVRGVELNGKLLVIVHTAQGFFALDGRCPHRGGPLAEGDVIGDEIVCPWHLWGFRADTGTCPGNPEIAVETHELRVEGGRLLVRLCPALERAASAT